MRNYVTISDKRIVTKYRLNDISKIELALKEAIYALTPIFEITWTLFRAYVVTSYRFSRAQYMWQQVYHRNSGKDSQLFQLKISHPKHYAYVIHIKASEERNRIYNSNSECSDINDGWHRCHVPYLYYVHILAVMLYGIMGPCHVSIIHMVLVVVFSVTINSRMHFSSL